MRLTKMTRSVKSPERWYAEFEDGTRLRVGTALIADLSLFTGAELDEEAFASLRTAAGRESARARALNILGSRSLSRREIKDRLMKKGETEERAEETAAWLESAGFVNDAEYAAQLVRHYAAKEYGQARIRDELYRRGVPKELWKEALALAPEPDDALDRLVARRLSGKQPDKKELGRLSAHLMRRGFSWEDIRSALDRYGARTEDDYE